MTGKELLLRALKGEKTERPAWLPYVGCHGGQLVGATAEQYLQSADLIVEGLSKARELYKPDGLPIVFDLQLEAEVLGCELHWAEKTPPSVVSHPMSMLEGEGKTLADLPAFSTEAGRFPMVLEATDRVAAAMGDDVALYGLLTGPFTLTSHLMGNDLFMAMYDSPEGVIETMDFCANIACQVIDAYVAHGIDVVAVVDPMTSQISPEHFTQFVTPAVNKVFDHIRAAGAAGSMFVCGDATRNLEVMAATHCDNVAIDEQIPLPKIRQLTAAAGKSFGGNLKLTTVLLMGDSDDAKLNAIQCIDDAGDAGFILAPGCDLPYDVKPENVAAVAEMVHDAYRRDITRQTVHAKAGDTFDDVTLPDYEADDAVIVDVVTLDSEGCAPCQYMFSAAMEARGRLTDDVKVEVREHKITTRQGVGMMVKLGVPNLPSICIDGKCEFASIIPETKVLADRIADAAKRKRQAN
jgi:MtaA/CmuA family methyltransferase